MIRILFLGAVSAAAVLMSGTSHAGKILDGVKQKGILTCGVHTGRAGFALPDATGVWKGLDVDFCRAVAAAVLGDASKVKYVPTTGQTRFSALQSGEVDLLARNVTYTYARDTSLGLDFVGINFYDGQAFLTKKAPGVDSVKKLGAATVCVETGTTSERNMTEYSRINRLALKPMAFPTTEIAAEAFAQGRCKALTGDYGALVIFRATGLQDPDEHVLLPELISKEPLGPMVKKGDDEWLSIVKWTLNAMIEAEELEIYQNNIERLKASSSDPAIRRFVGTGEDLGKHIGLDKDWSYRIVSQVGNYAESFDSNLGRASRLRLPRGQMRLWKNGGLMYSPPLR